MANKVFRYFHLSLSNQITESLLYFYISLGDHGEEAVPTFLAGKKVRLVIILSSCESEFCNKWPGARKAMLAASAVSFILLTDPLFLKSALIMLNHRLRVKGGLRVK